MDPKNLVLQLETEPAVCLATQWTDPKLVRYKKELIKVGNYVKASTGQAFKVTSETLDHWVSTFNRWVKNGNKVAIPLGHDQAGRPEANMGWVTMLHRGKDSLFGILELLNPELALVSDVSICVEGEVIDGKGQRYVHPITHVSLCTDPVIPGLEKFEKLSLSKGDSDMDLKKLAALLGIEESALTEDLIIAALDPKKVLQPAATVTDPSQIAASQSVAVDPGTVKTLGDLRTLKLNTLVTAGAITPFVRDIIHKKYIETKALTLALSHGGNDGFDVLYEVLTKNKPTAAMLGEKSEAQVLMELSGGGQQQPNEMEVDLQRRCDLAGVGSN